MLQSAAVGKALDWQQLELTLPASVVVTVRQYEDGKIGDRVAVHVGAPVRAWRRRKDRGSRNVNPSGELSE